MESKNIYGTLRIRYKDQLKLFPSVKLLSLESIKMKAISRFDLMMKNYQFDLEYFDWESKGVLGLENVQGTNQIDTKIIAKLIQQKIQLQIVRKQKNVEKQMIKQPNRQDKQGPRQIDFEGLNEQYKKQARCNKADKHYVQCDKCLKYPILGIRYKCIICQDYDLCQTCYDHHQEQAGAKSHPYIKIRRPIEQIQSIKVAFHETKMDKMISCKERQMQHEIIQKDFSKLQIDQSTLPRKTEVSKNFMEEIFGASCAKRVYKTHPTLGGT